MGKIKEAIAKMEETILIAPSDVNLVFQLGLLYFNGDQFENAKLALERAISLAIESNQEYANARYYLGLTYDKLNQKEKAIEQFEKIQTANPDNEEIKKILFNLKSGKPALEGITPQGNLLKRPAPPLRAAVAGRRRLRACPHCSCFTRPTGPYRVTRYAAMPKTSAA